MPALKGSLSYVRLFVEGGLPSDFRERFTKALRLRAMKPLDPDEEAMERSGWATLGDPFEVELRHEDVFVDDFVNLAFRTDKWVIPGSVLKAALKEAEAAALGRKGRERLSRKEKAELKELVVKKLRKKLPPVTRAADLTWSLDEGVVRFFSHSEKTITAMTDLFERTFHLKLVPEAPYTLAARLGLSKEQDALWATLEGIDLVPAEA